MGQKYAQKKKGGESLYALALSNLSSRFGVTGGAMDLTSE